MVGIRRDFGRPVGEVQVLMSDGDGTNQAMGKRTIHRLRIVEGRPWKEALLCALEPYATFPAWHDANEVEPGDVAIVVIDTDPQTVLCAVPLASIFHDFVRDTGQ